MQMTVTREWRAGMVEFAAIGIDGAAVENRWCVRTGRTESGRAMERTDEAMVNETLRHFATSAEAVAWASENGYR